MKRKIFKSAIIVVCLLSLVIYLPAQKISEAKKVLSEQYDVIPKHSKDTQYFEMESRLQSHALDGSRLGLDIYHLYLRCVPSSDSSKGDEYTCLRFTVQINNAPEVSVPSLTNWKYYFSLTPTARDEKGQVFGIDHGKFENLKDENGNTIPTGNTYHVYNAFIDFHSMYVFSEKSPGNGAQNLKHLGDKVVHAASFSQAPVNLGSQVEEGSYFKNGEVTLQLKGLGLVNGKNCALLEYDSGESSFYMIMKPMSNIEVTTKGSSHYWGDIYKDLASGWIQKATLHEVVISETNVPAMSKINSVIDRSILIKNIRRPNL
jgi:hypothetical protein